MFMVSGLHRILAAPEERNVLRTVVYNISLVWSSYLSDKRFSISIRLLRS
jgi:hypothetical protein